MLAGNPQISIHAAREGGDRYCYSAGGGSCISIHAAREGGDVRRIGDTLAAKIISIHAAREGGDYAVIYGFTQNGISIHAAREGGDRIGASPDRAKRYFNPRRP